MPKKEYINYKSVKRTATGPLSYAKIEAWNTTKQIGRMRVKGKAVLLLRGKLQTHIKGDLTGHWVEFEESAVVPGERRPGYTGPVSKVLNIGAIVHDKVTVARLEANYNPPDKPLAIPGV